MARPKKREKSVAKRSVFPINQFPREILAEIFWYCQENFEPWRGPVLMLKTAAPLSVSSICSSWRELALATPKLWTTVGMILRGSNTLATATVINTWLERSGSLPLKLYLAQLPLPDDPNDDPAFAQSILSAFYSHSSRWQDVTLHLYAIQTFSLPQLDAPLLRSFGLSGPRQEMSHLPFRNSSRLMELTWPSPIDVSKNPQIPWSQISYLDISSGMTPFSVSELIHMCPILEEISVGCFDFGEVANLPREPKVENSRLRKLELRVDKDISPLLHSLTLPALEQFICSQCDRIPISLSWESLLGLLTRSHCKLTTLRLEDCKFSADEFLECLEHKASETIQMLSIDGWPKLTDDVLLRLTYRPSPTAPRILLPKLTHLTFVDCLVASPGVLGEMVSSRCYPKTGEMEQLKLLILAEYDLDKKDETIIQDRAADGLRACISILDRDDIEAEIF